MTAWNPSLIEDPALTDIRFADIEGFKNDKTTAYPTNQRAQAGTVLFMEPTHSTQELHLYLLDKARKIDIQMYGWGWPEFQAALVAKKKANPAWDVQVLVNRNGFMDPGSMRDIILAEPFLKQKTWFTLGTGEGDVNGVNSGRIMHRKAMIIDGVWFCHGSTNLDTSSIEYQANTFMITYDPALCAEAALLFKRTRDWNVAKGAAWSQVP